MPFENDGRKTAKQYIEELNQLDEHLQIEAKSGFGDSALESVCAFSNEPDLGGGVILLGVEKDAYSLFPFYSVKGLDDPDKITANLASQCAIVFNLPIRPTITVEQVDGKTVLLIVVREVSAAEKPIYFKKSGLPQGAYRRIGSTDQRCTEDDIATLFDGRRLQSFDDRLLPGASLDDFDVAAIEHYRTLRRRVNPAAEELHWNDQELLQALSAVHSDGGQLKPTLAGILLFGTRQVLRRLLPSVRVDYIRIPGKEWIEKPDSRFSTTDMRGPLLQLVQRVQDQVFEDLPKAFALDEGEMQARSDTLPARVLREAIVNAVMHASYRVHQPIQILRYSNRLEIRNPGYSLKNEDQLGQPGSRLRNPKIAAVFHETNTAETKGSGIRTMGRLMEEAGFAPPTFESDRGNDNFTARLLLHHFLTSEDLSWLMRFGCPDLTDGQKRALIFVRESGAIDNQVYRQINAVDTLAASTELRRLRDLGLLKMKGRSNATYYIPDKKFLEHLEEPSRKALEKELQPSVEGQTHKLAAQTHNLPFETHKFKKLPDELCNQLKSLSKRPGTQRREYLILELCKYDAWTSAELAQLLKIKDPLYLQRVYLKPLLQQHKLAYVYPDMPHHPKQAYQCK